MGFESRATGYIACRIPPDRDRVTLAGEISKRVDELPGLSDDNWPFLPREIFSISYTEPGLASQRVSYDSIIVHFGMSVKELEWGLDEWLRKYEIFMKSVPGVCESLVNIQMVPYSARVDIRHFTYWWLKEAVPGSGETSWKYIGGPRSLDELGKS